VTRPKSLLVVEDEFLIRDLIQTALEDAGFSAIIVGHGGEAMQLLGTDGLTISALITDVGLGDGPDGWALARAARRLRPQLPVIYLSGRDGHEWPSQGVPNSAFLQKPLTISQIVAAAHAVIDAPLNWLPGPRSAAQPGGPIFTSL